MDLLRRGETSRGRAWLAGSSSGVPVVMKHVADRSLVMGNYMSKRLCGRKGLVSSHLKITVVRKGRGMLMQVPRKDQI